MSDNTNKKIDYEAYWNQYAQNWSQDNPDKQYIGDEWIGRAAGAAQSLEEYVALIEQKFVAPYIKPQHKVLEIGIGGGRTAEILIKYAKELICADISTEMLEATKQRLGDQRISYVKLDGLTLDQITPNSVDVCFCYDTMVHLEPRDIFNYLSRIPRLLKSNLTDLSVDRLCIFHHTNTLSELGWQRFLKYWDQDLLGRSGGSFSVMTNSIMEKFLQHLNYKVLVKDTQSVPRDCVWIVQAPLCE